MSKNNEITKERNSVLLKNNIAHIERNRNKLIWHLAFLISPRLRRRYADYLKAESDEDKLDACTAVLNEFDMNLVQRLYIKRLSRIEDARLRKESKGRRKVIDNSDHNDSDYYSVVVIIKNEARYIKEFILFYQATGADRIYIYDNDSTDELMEEIDPFIESGFVVYIRWPGNVAQNAAYRDAVRRTKKRTKWLAIVDVDEFLFSSKGSMPDQLREYEEYPGIGVNWVIFGPNGHDRRPEGLVMDNYTKAIKNHDNVENCHIKSIVQPDSVFCVNQVHYSIYKHGRFAVDENKNQIDNRNALMEGAGKAFTAENHREIFRINHYKTKSLEDLEEKCARGYSDGAPNAQYENILLPFRESLEEDNTIRPYADMIRNRLHFPTL